MTTWHALSVNIRRSVYPFQFLFYVQNVDRTHHLCAYVFDKIPKNVVRAKCSSSLPTTLVGICVCEYNFSFTLLPQRKGKMVLIILAWHQEFKEIFLPKNILL